MVYHPVINTFKHKHTLRTILFLRSFSKNRPYNQPNIQASANEKEKQSESESESEKEKEKEQHRESLCTDFFWKGKKEFMGSAVMGGYIPETVNLKIPQIGFLGRSNAGKSTLINSLLNEKLAKTSQTPGSTKSLNFYQVRKHLLLVDMPGYGHNCKPEWYHQVESYALKHKNLKRIFLLIDSRRGITELDKGIMSAFDVSGVSYHIVLTKIDLVTEFHEVAGKVQEYVDQNTSSCFPRISLVSSKKEIGVEEMHQTISLAANLNIEALMQLETTPHKTKTKKIAS